MTKAWQSRKLGDVLEVQNGYAFDSKLFSLSKGMPLIRIRDLKGGISTETRYSGNYDAKYIVEAGDLLIGMDGEFGCYDWKGEPALLNQRVCRLQGFNGDVDPRFLFYGVNSHLKAIEEVTGYATVKHLSSKQILGIDFPLPPIVEQRRIVGILDEAFAGIATARANAEKNLQNARALFESHLHAVFTQRGAEWAATRLGDIVERLTNGYVGPTRNIYVLEGTPYLLARHVRDNVLTFDGKTFITEEFNRKNKKSTLKAGDVLLVQSGHIGHSAVVTEEHASHNCHAMIVITPVASKLLGPFLSLFFNSSVMREEFEAIRSGSTVPHLTCGAVKELMIPLPDLRTQRTVVAEVQLVAAETQRLEALYQRKFDALDELKRSLLDQAFRGQL